MACCWCCPLFDDRLWHHFQVVHDFHGRGRRHLAHILSRVIGVQIRDLQHPVLHDDARVLTDLCRPRVQQLFQPLPPDDGEWLCAIKGKTKSNMFQRDVSKCVQKNESGRKKVTKERNVTEMTGLGGGGESSARERKGDEEDEV